MRLTYLRVQGFRCFSEAQRIEFPPAGILPIVGERLDGGSSGAGKTSVMQAIAFALKFSSFAAERQQCWLPDSPPLQVDLGLETEDGAEKLDIRRGKKTEMLINGNLEASGATEVNRKLLTYFGMEPDLLQVLTFRPQRKGGLFLGLAPSKKRVFLASVLGLKRFEDLADALGKETVELSKQLAIQEALLSRVSIPPEPEPRTKSFEWADDFFTGTVYVDAEPVFKSVYDARYFELGEAVAKISDFLEAGKQGLANDMRERDEKLAATRAAGEAKSKNVVVPRESVQDDTLALTQERLRKLQDKRSTTAQKLNDVQVAAEKLRRSCQTSRAAVSRGENDVENAQRVVDSLLAQKCHTCGQPWKSEQQLEQSQKALDGAKALVADRQRLLNQDEALLSEALRSIEEELQPVIAKCEEGIEALRANIEKARSQAAAAELEYQKRVSDLRASIAAETAKAIEEILSHYEASVSAGQKVNHANETRLLVLRQQYHSNRGCYDTCLQRLEAVRKHNATIDQLWKAREKAERDALTISFEVSTLRVKLDEKQDLQTATRAFLGAISEEVLAEIRDEANAMLATLPNVQGVGIRFVTESPTEAGQLRQEVKTVMTYGSEDDIDPESQLSGGQLTSVELAVDRAVSKVMRRRRGGHRLPSWMALDETFDGHDSRTKEACLDFLRTDVGDAQLFIIDHAAELKDAFEHTITVKQHVDGTTLSIS